MQPTPPRIAAVVPCFRVRDHIVGVLTGLTPVVDAVFVVDDGCPERTGQHVLRHARENPWGEQVQVIAHPENQGVGAAVITGYCAAEAAGFDIIVKVDGDGQMDPADLPTLLRPLLDGQADYTKGDRLATPALRHAMPPARVVGNLLMSALARAMTGERRLRDPMNGFTAITAPTLRRLRLDALDRRFFFETDLLVQLARLGARVADVPLPARYGAERSNLRLRHILRHFPLKIGAHLLRRLRSCYDGSHREDVR